MLRVVIAARSGADCIGEILPGKKKHGKLYWEGHLIIRIRLVIRELLVCKSASTVVGLMRRVVQQSAAYQSQP